MSEPTAPSSELTDLHESLLRNTQRRLRRLLDLFDSHQEQQQPPFEETSERDAQNAAASSIVELSAGESKQQQQQAPPPPPPVVFVLSSDTQTTHYFASHASEAETRLIPSVYETKPLGEEQEKQEEEAQHKGWSRDQLLVVLTLLVLVVLLAVQTSWQFRHATAYSTADSVQSVNKSSRADKSSSRGRGGGGGGLADLRSEFEIDKMRRENEENERRLREEFDATIEQMKREHVESVARLQAQMERAKNWWWRLMHFFGLN